MASTICSFANADGGDIAIGITNRKRLIEGVDFEMNKLNDILRAPLDYCSPTVEIETEYVPCVDMKGQENQCSCNTFIWKESAVVFSTCQSEIHSV